ncbi:beta strand repeat-containing protein [Mariniflexile sp. HMF6888]|uniref:beta strand repeat-containing protein n=1 Tax=Mariniflexile sp. HMF6888 TaxID=3373086 RepID=UPI00379A00B5
MKKTLQLLLLILVGFQGFSQTAGISYQAVILNRNTKELPGANAQTNILANSKIFVQFTIIDDFNNQEYQEYHQTTTDIYGMVNLLIGHGTKKGSNNFEDVSWNGFSKKLKVDIDFSGKGNAYTLLSEQELTFMPQPALVEDVEAILKNAEDIIDEQNRAILAESFLQVAIDENKTSAEAAIAINSNALAAEVMRATNAEAAIDSKLVTEVSNLTIANATLQTNIDVVQSDVDANETAANNAIAAVQTDVDANEAASNTADATLQTNINAVQSDVNANETAANNAIAAVQTDVDANEGTSLAADIVLQTNINAVQSDVDANETASNTADATLQTNINVVQADVDANETAVNTAIATVQSDVDANETAANNAIAAVQTDVDANEAASSAADATLQTNINAVQADVDANETAANTAIATVQLDVDTNEAASLTADTVLQTNINAVQSDVDANETASNTADAALQTNINAVQADIDANETAANTAIAAVQSDVDANETAANNAIAAVQTDVDANEAASNTADTVLQTNINAVQSDVDANETASNTADATLQTNINAVQADVDANETAANTAIAAVQSDVDANETAANNAIAAVQTDVDANEATSLAADTVLQTNINTVQADVDANETATNNALALKANIASPTFTGTVSGIDKTMVGLGNVDNTSDANKPVSTATQTALDLKVDKVTGERLINAAEITKLSNQSGTNTGDQDLSSYATNSNLALKANIASPTFTGTVSGIDKTMVGLGNVDNTSDANKPVSTATQTALDLKVDKVTGERLINAAEITKLSNQSGTNTGDQDLSSYATNSNLALKADIASPTFTGTVSGISATMVGLGNVDNTSDANKPVSTATQTALDLKAPLASPMLTGTPLAPTATAGTSTTQIATTAFVTGAITTASTPDASATVKGKIQLAGDLSGTAALPSIANDAVTSAKIADGTIVNADINASAAIAFSKLNISKSDIEGLGIPGEDTDTTYSAGTGLTLIGTTLSIDSNVVTSNYLGAITTTGFIKSGGTASQFLKADGSVDATSYAPLASPTFTGTPLAPTATTGTNTTQLATTAFVTTAISNTMREVADEFTATASQTSFTLTQTPSVNSKVKMFVNGIRISNTAYSVSGTALTYMPANNGGYNLSLNDRIQFDYYY